MRIHRIRLANFCGVVESEARFAPEGVTIVEGPNEAGKSTMLSALDLLFDYRDDSRSEDVRAAKPVDRDVGAEVEADIEIGDCSFTYFKRFHRECQTRLTVRTPGAENLTGREAHDRVQQLLDSSLDTALWRALRIIQGEKIEMPDIKGQPALAQALDRAAGEVRGGEREEVLIDAAHAEYLKYWTDKGKERDDPLKKARTTANVARSAAEDFRQKLASLDGEITRYASLDRGVSDLRKSLGHLEESLAKAEREWGAVSKLQAEADRLRAKQEAAAAVARAAKNLEEERGRLAEAAREANRRLDELMAKETDAQPAMQKAMDDLKAARGARDSSRAAAETADKEETVRRMDREFRHDELELARMEERLSRIQEAEESATAASESLAGISITEALRNMIRSADVESMKARARFEASSSQLHIKALQDVAVKLDGAPAKFVRGEERSVGVPETVTVRIEELVEVKVSPGSSDAELRESLEASERELASACEAAGIRGPDEAETAWAARQEAVTALAARDRVVKENLRDLTRDDIEKRIESTRFRVQAYRVSRPVAPPLPPSLDDAKSLLARAEDDSVRAKADLKRTSEVFEATREVHDQLREAAAVDTALLEQTRKDVERFSARLAQERVSLNDETITNQRQAADAADRQATEDLRSARSLLSAADPEITAERLAAAREARKKAITRLGENERHLVLLRGRLETLGEQGLAEALAQAERVCFEAESALARCIRRAEAAKLLFDTLASERDAARRAYVAPLREAIEHLGRHVFGPTFHLEINDELRVVSRTLQDKTVPFESLSSGAREQIGLLVRLAVALIVARDGGIPLVLDDALGSTDPERLEGVGAVLSSAGRHCQVIVLTCSPERYAHVDAAARVRVEALRPS